MVGMRLNPLTSDQSSVQVGENDYFSSTGPFVHNQ